MRIAGLHVDQLSQTCSFLFKPADDLVGLAEVTGTVFSALVPLKYARVESSELTPLFSFFGHPLPQHMIRPMRPKICPQCLLETGYCHRRWDLLLVTTCPVHGCMLIDECPKCKRNITWVRAGVSICRCGFDWRLATCQAAGETELRLTQHIHRLCELPAPVRGISSVASPALTLGLRDFMSAVLFIVGQYVSVTGSTRSQFIFSMRGKGHMSNSQIHPLLIKAFSVFDSWPINYHSFLEWRCKQAGNIAPKNRKLKTDVLKELNKFYTGLRKHLPSKRFDFVRVEFNKYLDQALHKINIACGSAP